MTQNKANIDEYFIYTWKETYGAFVEKSVP